MPHRMIANRLKDCAFSEKPGPVWRNIVYDEYSKQLRLPFNHGPPEAWKTMTPTVGTLSLDYVASVSIPEDAVVLTEDQILPLLKNEAILQSWGELLIKFCSCLGES